MNEPLRYKTTKVVGEYGSAAREQHRIHLAPDAEGKWVRWSDYTQLKSINESFSRSILRLGDECRDLANDNARLKAEVERLTELNATISLRYDATKSMLDGCAKEIEEMEAEVERLTKAVMHSPAAQLKLKELEGKTTYEEINPDNQ